MRMDWRKVATLDDLPEGGTLSVDVDGTTICLYNLAGRVYATQDSCTHEEASLAEGFIDGDCIECPLHQAVFHIPTGAVRGHCSSDKCETLLIITPQLVSPR